MLLGEEIKSQLNKRGYQMSEFLSKFIEDSYNKSMYKLSEIIMKKIKEQLLYSSNDMYNLEYAIDSYYYIKSYAKQNNELLPDIYTNIESDKLIKEILKTLEEVNNKQKKS